MNLHDKVIIPSQVLVNPMDDEIIVLDLASGTYFGLDPVGSHIWAFLSEGKTIAETCQGMLAKYDVSPNDIERDVVNLTNLLLTKNLVQIAPS
jgi:hypothetical protein